MHADPVPHAVLLIVDQIAAGRLVPGETGHAVVAQIQQALQLVRLLAVLRRMAGLDPDLALLERQIEQRLLAQRHAAAGHRARSRRGLGRLGARRRLDFDRRADRHGCDLVDRSGACRRPCPRARERRRRHRPGRRREIRHVPGGRLRHLSGSRRGSDIRIGVKQLLQRVAALARSRCLDGTARLRQRLPPDREVRLGRFARARDEARQHTGRALAALFPGLGLSRCGG